MKSFLAALVLLAAPAAAQVGISLEQACSGEMAAERACVEFESSLAHFLDIRDEVTRGMQDAGGGICERGRSCDVLMMCDQCSVDKKIPGCEVPTMVVVLSRWEVTAHRMACVWTKLRAQKLEREAQEEALSRLNRHADIGVGVPVVKRGGEVVIRVDYGGGR